MKSKYWFFCALVLLVTPLLFTTACKPTAKLNSLIYFRDSGDSALARAVQNNEAMIAAGDRLNILVDALDKNQAVPYNNPSTAGYIVDNYGYILFPQLGRLNVAGMKRQRLEDTLRQALIKYLVDPIVTVQFLNFKITLLGEVNRPGTITIPEGKVTLVEAIGLGGDLTITSRRDNILVIREKNGKREFGTVNMLSKNVFASPYFVLQQNDVVYVQPTGEKISGSEQSFIRTLAIVTSVLSVFSTLVFLVVNLIK